MGQALYRKYRSRALNELVGQEHITDTLDRAIKAGRISHAYLFTGPRGTGKTSVARILAHQINDLPYSDAPNLDIIEIDAASNRRIDDIRDLRDKVHIAPVNAKYKVYIIDEVHMLTGESFNALLKTLEEPPAHVVFILATTEVHKLPATIISRTQRYSFRPGNHDKVVAHLKMIAQKENIDITDDALSLIAEHGEGSFRDSLSLLDQMAHISNAQISAEDVANALGLAPKTRLEALLQATLANNHAEIAATLADLEQRGGSVSAIVGQLSKLLVQQAATRPSLYALADKLLDVPHAYSPSLKLLTTLVGFAAEQPPKNVAETTALEPVIVSKTVAEVRQIAKVTQTPDVVTPASPEPPKQEQSSKPIIQTAPIDTLPPDDWQRILQAVKAKNPPIFAVLKQAMPTTENGTLLLSFKFALHGKKLDDAKQKALVTEIIQSVLGSAPEIKVVIDKNAMPPPASSDPAVASVAAIMGGGEVVQPT